MKLLSAIPILGAVIVLMFSCQSNEIDLSQKYPNMVANLDPVPAGSIEVELDKLFSSQVKAYNVNIIFHPRLNSVALEFRYEFITYRQYWDEAARKQFAEALESYKGDYADRKLVDRFNKTRLIYGKTKGRLEWEAFKYTRTHVSFPTITLGYRFRNKMPYFITHMRTAREIDEVSDNETRESSNQVIMYFTRAQADDLVKFFDQSYLMGLISGMEGSGGSGAVVENDYVEFGN